MAGSALLVGCSSGGTIEPGIDGTPSTACVVRPAQTQGPYFVDERLNRSDIRSDPGDAIVKAGIPLVLGFIVSRISGSSCSALAGAYVDVWHCDAPSQLYFNDALTDTVHAQQPYAAKGQRNTRNSNDGIYQSGGSQLLLQPTQSGSGYAADFQIGLQI